MGWLADFLKAIRPTTEVTKWLVAEIKELRDRAEKKNEEYEKRIKSLEAQVQFLTKMEIDCHQQVIPLLQENRDLREEIIFKNIELKKLIEKGNEQK